jgi:hypothetical protein
MIVRRRRNVGAQEPARAQGGSRPSPPTFRGDLVEMKMPQKVETRGAKDMGVLQGLNGIPIATLFERLKRRGGNRYRDGLSAREEAAQSVGLEIVGKPV